MASKMRTISQTVAWLLENDPESALTQTALRRLVTTGQIPSVRVGQKYLINLDTLEEFLQGSTPAPAAVHGILGVKL